MIIIPTPISVNLKSWLPTPVVGEREKPCDWGRQLLCVHCDTKDSGASRPCFGWTLYFPQPSRYFVIVLL